MCIGKLTEDIREDIKINLQFSKLVSAAHGKILAQISAKT